MLAIIPARGGSKGIPRKNMVNILGKPLIQYTIEAALNCKEIETVLVSTDDPEIFTFCQQFQVKVENRPAELATDDTSTESVIKYILTLHPIVNEFVLLQPTSPLRSASHIQTAIDIFSKNPSGSVVSVTELNHSAQKSLIEGDDGNIQPLLDWETLGYPRQNLARSFRPNGAIYITNSKSFMQRDSLYNFPVKPFIMTKRDSIDIDDPHDVQLMIERMTAE